MKKLACLVLALILTGCSMAWAMPDFEKLADAIHLAENGKQKIGEAYGIHTVHYKDESEARQICLHTIRHKYQDWNKQGNFLQYLSTRYCPVNHRVWFKNVSFFYEGGF